MKDAATILQNSLERLVLSQQHVNQQWLEKPNNV